MLSLLYLLSRTTGAVDVTFAIMLEILEVMLKVMQ